MVLLAASSCCATPIFVHIVGWMEWVTKGDLGCKRDPMLTWHSHSWSWEAPVRSRQQGRLLHLLAHAPGSAVQDHASRPHVMTAPCMTRSHGISGCTAFTMLWILSFLSQTCAGPDPSCSRPIILEVERGLLATQLPSCMASISLHARRKQAPYEQHETWSFMLPALQLSPP